MWEPGQPMPRPIMLPCGSTAVFDRESGISYRCTSCFAVVGSVGMPRACAALYAEHGAEEKQYPGVGQ